MIKELKKKDYLILLKCCEVRVWIFFIRNIDKNNCICFKLCRKIWKLIKFKLKSLVKFKLGNDKFVMFF